MKGSPKLKTLVCAAIPVSGNLNSRYLNVLTVFNPLIDKIGLTVAVTIENELRSVDQVEAIDLNRGKHDFK